MYHRGGERNPGLRSRAHKTKAEGPAKRKRRERKERQETPTDSILPHLSAEEEEKAH